MVIYAIDDEKHARNLLVNMILKAEPGAEVLDFEGADDALEALDEVMFDVVFLDIQMPKVNGIELAKKFKKINPLSNIVFVTGYSEYMADAFELDASGYLLKPVSADRIRHALDNLRYSYQENSNPDTDLSAQCFGDFELFYKGKPVVFKYNKSKEVIAFLIDRKGAMCSNNEVIINIWDDDDEHSSYYRSILKDISDTFRSLGCEDFFIRKRAGAAINKELINCDYFDYLDDKPSGINAFRGEYMNQYSWAEETAGNLY